MVDRELQANWRGLADEACVGMADWRTAHPKATFADIEREVDDRLAQLRNRVLGDVASASAARDVAGQDEGERPRCPECGGVLEARGQQTRDLATLRGEVRLKRSYTVCRECGHGLFPPR